MWWISSSSSEYTSPSGRRCSAPKTEPAARSLRVDEKQAIGDDDETAAALRTMLKQARKLGDDALVTSLQQQLFEMGAETRRIELES